MPNISDVVSFIVSSSDTDYQRIISAIKERNRQKNYIGTVAFTVGDPVHFKGRWGKIEHGKVNKINRTTITVTTDDGKVWRVGASILTKD